MKRCTTECIKIKLNDMTLHDNLHMYVSVSALLKHQILQRMMSTSGVRGQQYM